MLEDCEDINYTGARSGNEALNKLMEICNLIKNGQDIDDHSKLPFNDLKFTKLLKNVFQKDSNINFLFSVPLVDYNPHMFFSKPSQRSINMLKQLVEIKMANSRSHNLSCMTKMRDYDRIKTTMDFSTRVNCG